MFPLRPEQAIPRVLLAQQAEDRQLSFMVAEYQQEDIIQTIPIKPFVSRGRLFYTTARRVVEVQYQVQERFQTEAALLDWATQQPEDNLLEHAKGILFFIRHSDDRGLLRPLWGPRTRAMLYRRIQGSKNHPVVKRVLTGRGYVPKKKVELQYDVLTFTNSSCCFSPRYAPTIKRTNPAVIIISNYTLERCYHKALAKDPTALDSLLTRLEQIHLTAPLDIEGLREVLAPASAATTVIPTTLAPVEDSNVTTLTRVEELAASNSTIDLSPPNSPHTESVSSTPPLVHHSVQQSMNRYQINEEELIPCQQEEVEREETTYERFMRERREKLRKQQQEEDKLSAIDRIAVKGKTILYTGYN